MEVRHLLRRQRQRRHIEEATADDEADADNDDEESPYHRTVLTGTDAYTSYAPWLRAQLSASNLGLGQPVTPGGDALERKNHCQGLKEMGKARDACSAMAQLLPVSAHSLTGGAVAGIGAINEKSSKALVLCSIWVDPSHRRQGLWQRLLLDLLDEIEPHVLELGSGLVTAFNCNPGLRRCLESIGWKSDTARGYLQCSDARDAMQRALGAQQQHQNLNGVEIDTAARGGLTTTMFKCTRWRDAKASCCGAASRGRRLASAVDLPPTSVSARADPATRT